MSDRFRFANTEQAEAVGRVMSIEAFPALVKEYLEAEKELDAVRLKVSTGGASLETMQRCIDEATRHQLLREAIETFVENFSGANGATREDAEAPTGALFGSAPDRPLPPIKAPAAASPQKEDAFHTIHGVRTPLGEISLITEAGGS